VRLTQINLAGFKSFVDPTRIPIPGQLVGIVGPNGCGKSNVIDAVRWVLGETSARHLRGETMQDVLFSGSGQRKPVNRASVELVFDNSLGKAAGQWSQYAEISIRRVIQRDGDSSYYINNIHVRRRDIADIFLGTGLGARAYAIIEQGMISRVIEAKPEELRVFLEEAAGVSKYRERRRETELRLKDTRENLLRVDDIRQELEKQLEHLQTQAEVASRFHELQRELTTTQGLLWLTRRSEATAARNRHTREIERVTVELESETAKLREAEKRLEVLREEHYRSGDALHTAQGALYESNAEVARIEQQIAHVRENRERIEYQIANLRTQVASTEGQLKTAEGNLDRWRGEMATAREALVTTEAALSHESEKLPIVEEAFRASNNRRHEVQQALGRAEQALQVEQTKLAHAARVLEQLGQREERLLEEQGGLATPDGESLQRLEAESRTLEQTLGEQRESLLREEAALPQLEQTLRERLERSDAVNQQATELTARIAALTQLQERIARGADLKGWLDARGLDAAPRLWQGISIEAGWEDALESVLRERLNALTLDDMTRAEEWLVDAPPGKLALVEMITPAPVPGTFPPEGMEPLRRFVTCRDERVEPALQDWLHQVYVVADTTTVMAFRSALPAGAKLVTREGHIYTRHSVSLHAPDSELHGVLSRQREIEALEARAAETRGVLAAEQARVADAERAIETHRAALTALRQAVAAAQQRHHVLQMEALRLSEQAQRLKARAEQISAELVEIEAQKAAESARGAQAEAQREQLEEDTLRTRAELDAATELYGRAESVLAQQREALDTARHAHQEALYQARSTEEKVRDVEESIRTLTERSASLAATLDAEEKALAECDEAPLQAQVQDALSVRGEREKALAAARDALAVSETQLKELEQERLALEQRLGPLRERVGEIRLKEQEARLAEEQFAQQLADSGADEAALQAMLAKGTRSGAMQAEIARLNEEIRLLGAVNLAALEELQSAQERKTYLDAQSQDLREAMTTLEDAIRRIDRETRERLQTTFDEVNAHFGKMFPALFGGGTAKLLLTGDEILDSGVQVIAQPPGKKNTSIHLLSGGEKALTALSLVFSMFQLNPAPFCLLDEVDAPLDDYNTGRFCDLVRKMSEQSQFLFISHNKITMEIANQLLGITMQEPGVSRVVAVDIEEAMKLTEEAAA
jgi:chromosome segregation protein